MNRTFILFFLKIFIQMLYSFVQIFFFKIILQKYFIPNYSNTFFIIQLILLA